MWDQCYKSLIYVRWDIRIGPCVVNEKLLFGREDALHPKEVNADSSKKLREDSWIWLHMGVPPPPSERWHEWGDVRDLSCGDQWRLTEHIYVASSIDYRFMALMQPSDVNRARNEETHSWCAHVCILYIVEVLCGFYSIHSSTGKRSMLKNDREWTNRGDAFQFSWNTSRSVPWWNLASTSEENTRQSIRSKALHCRVIVRWRSS